MKFSLLAPLTAPPLLLRSSQAPPLLRQLVTSPWPCPCWRERLIDASHTSSVTSHNLHVPEPVALAPLAATPDGPFSFAGGLSGKKCVLYGQLIMVLGENMEKNISDFFVASGIGDDKRQGVRVDDDMNKSVGRGAGLSGKEFTRSVKDTVDIEDFLSEAAKDGSKSIQMLESAIGMWERLLELIVKEAKGGTSRNCP